jgi:transcriptional regulator with XRE-family HTH domain
VDVETEIGTTLREARIRRKIDLADIEKQTKIRVRYLRALENEEWDLLPGPTYTRSFIRTYGLALGLDGERLADDFRRQQDEMARDLGRGREAASRPPRLPREGDGSPYRTILIGALAVVALIGALIVLGLTGGDDNGSSPGPADRGAATQQGKKGGKAGAQRKPGVSIELSATADVWVCAIAANGTPVVNGEILSTGTQRGPFRSGAFQLAFGNGSVDLRVDGKPFSVQDTPSPIGYQVTKKRVKLLPEGSRPDCT